MNKESLAKAILQGLKAQADQVTGRDRYLHIFGTEDINDISLYGPVDLRQLAESLLDYLSPKNEQPLSITGVESHPRNPVVRIVWGDGVVTYAHFTQEAEVVHMMGRDSVPNRFGARTPEEAMAS